MPPGPSSTRRDILSAYLASFTRIAAWATVSALVYRRLGPIPFALLALVRSTLGLLNYTSLGLGPALVHHFAQLAARTPWAPAPATTAGPPATPPPSSVLNYAPPTDELAPAQRAYATAVYASISLYVLGMALLIPAAILAPTWLRIPPAYTFETKWLIVTMGAGVLLRLFSDAAGAVLQTTGRLATDNLLLACADIAWVLFLAFYIRRSSALSLPGGTFLAANTLLVAARHFIAHRRLSLGKTRPAPDPKLGVALLSFGLLFTLAQLADFLYAPTDYLLINHLLSTKDLAAYAPCVQLDAALLLLVTGLSTALFPKAALAHARRDAATLRRYYLTGTLASTALLLIASLITWLAAPLLLRLWLHDIPPGTLAVLPLVLCHTVIGGSSAVGRSILLGAGKVKPFTASVLLAGLANVAVSYLLVRFTNLGLTAIILGTLTAVTARCALWTPWYTLRTLRQIPFPPNPDEPDLPPPPTPIA